MENLLVAVQNILDARIVKHEKFLADIATANNDLEPTLGKGGRLHSPCNGYTWNEDVYSKGQFLGLEFDYKNTGGIHCSKVVVTVALGTALKAILGKSVSFGKSWKQDGRTVSYAYISGLSLGEFKNLNKYSKQTKKSIELVSDLEAKGVSFGKSWKFSLRTASNYFNENYDFYELYVIENNLNGRIDFEFKNGKTTHKSPLKGKMVAYEYVVTNAFHDIEGGSSSLNDEPVQSEENMFVAMAQKIREASSDQFDAVLAEFLEMKAANMDAFNEAKNQGLI